MCSQTEFMSLHTSWSANLKVDLAASWNSRWWSNPSPESLELSQGSTVVFSCVLAAIIKLQNLSTLLIFNTLTEHPKACINKNNVE
jgi:hypothetical protein